MSFLRYLSRADLQALWTLPADGRLLHYRVQAGQGPTQIAADLASLGFDVKWTSIVDNNPSYFAHITTGRYNRRNSQYENLNMNTGDILDLGFLNSHYQRSGVGIFSGSGVDVYNEASRIIRQANFQDEDNPYSARDLIDVNTGGSALGSRGSMLGENFSRKSGDIYYGEFTNDDTGVEFSVTLADGGDRDVGTPFLGIYGFSRRTRAPNRQEFAHNPFAYTVTLPLLDGGFGTQPLIMTVGFKSENAAIQFFQQSTSSQ